jgi:membrane protein
MNRKEFWEIAKTSFRKWQTNNATLRAAALAFFTVMPLPSLLLMLTELSGLVYGQPSALQHLVQQISILVGPAVAGMFEQLLLSAENPFTSVLGSAVSIAFAVIGAIGAFTVMQDTLNIIWDVPPAKKRSIKERLRERTIPFLIVSGTGAIVVAWTTISTLLANALSFFLEPIIGNSAAIVLGATQILLSFGLSVLLFAFIYTQVPDAIVAWSDVWLASIITSLVITALNYLFGIYIRTFPVTTIAGAAGSLMVLLLWVFVVDQFILFGVQFSNVYSETVGSHAKKRKTRVEKPRREVSVTARLEALLRQVMRRIKKLATVKSAAD